MKRILFLMMAAALLVVGLAPAASATGKQVSYQKTDGLTFENEDDVGTAHLIRTRRGIYVSARANDDVFERRVVSRRRPASEVHRTFTSRSSGG